MRFLYLSQMAEPGDPRRRGDPARDVPDLPDEREIASELFGDRARWAFVDATVEPLPDPAAWDAVVVGGSLGSANDREPWRVALEAWLRAWGDKPILGICGGHQLLARASGGEVATMAREQIGVHPVAWAEPGWPGEVVQMHGEAVIRPPRGARVVARDAWGIQALRYGPGQLTVQFHPELSPAAAVVLRRRNPGDPDPWSGLERALAGGRALFERWWEEAHRASGAAPGGPSGPTSLQPRV